MPRKVIVRKKLTWRSWAKVTKYGNKKVFDPMHGNFDSELEHRVFLHLLRQQQQGIIHDLKRQVEIEVIPKSTFYKFKQLKTKFVYIAHHLRAMKYIADFTYIDRDGRLHVCDAKGKKTKEYQMKKKLLLALKNIYIEEWTEPEKNSYEYSVDIGFTDDIDTSKKYYMPAKCRLQ